MHLLYSERNALYIKSNKWGNKILDYIREGFQADYCFSVNLKPNKVKFVYKEENASSMYFYFRPVNISRGKLIFWFQSISFLAPLYETEVYFTQLKMNFRINKIIYTEVKFDITLVKIHFTMMIFNFISCEWYLQNWKSFLYFRISILKNLI